MYNSAITATGPISFPLTSVLSGRMCSVFDQYHGYSVPRETYKPTPACLFFLSPSPIRAHLRKPYKALPFRTQFHPTFKILLCAALATLKPTLSLDSHTPHVTIRLLCFLPMFCSCLECPTMSSLLITSSKARAKLSGNLPRFSCLCLYSYNLGS